MTQTRAKADVEAETERFRQFVIAARSDAAVGPRAVACLERLNGLYHRDRDLFSPEDARWLNVLRGYLGVRLAAHRPAAEHARLRRRKGDTLDDCWRCGTPVDERFVEFCTACSDKSYQWRVCPVCRACGCQRSGRVLA
jgi:hypothetical protein